MYAQLWDNPRPKTRQAFSLVELVIVVVIIGVLSAIAVPRITHSATHSEAEAVRASLINVRKAIDMFYAEHGQYPGFNPTNGTPDGDKFVEQLVNYTDINGRTRASYGYPYIYGPYLRAPFPTNPLKDSNKVAVKATPAAADPGGEHGWIAVLSHGYFALNATDAEIERLGPIRGDAGSVMGGGVKSFSTK
jgi:prepilin-type N-terminal cleavage/methylation domain-containing protein